MHTKLCGQIRQRLLAFDRSERHLCLEGCPMIAPRSLHRLAPWFAPLGVGLSKATTYHTVRISAPPLSHGGTGYWHVREINCKAIGGGRVRNLRAVEDYSEVSNIGNTRVLEE